MGLYWKTIRELTESTRRLEKHVLKTIRDQRLPGCERHGHPWALRASSLLPGASHPCECGPTPNHKCDPDTPTGWTPPFRLSSGHSAASHVSPAPPLSLKKSKSKSKPQHNSTSPLFTTAWYSTVRIHRILLLHSSIHAHRVASAFGLL